MECQNAVTIFLHLTDICSASQVQALAKGECLMEHVWSSMKNAINRRSFVKTGLMGAAGAGLLASNASLLAQEGVEEGSGSLTPGDAAMLRFAAAAELLESDFWEQYNELGGIQD